MKQYDNTINLSDVNQMIDDYFECRLTTEEERLLRDLLITGRYKSDKVDEAISVMGLGAILRNNKRTIARKLKFRRLIQAAAGIAIAITAGVAIYLNQGEGTQEVYYCCHNGIISEDASDAESFFLSQLSEAAEGASLSEESLSATLLEFQDIDL